MSTLNRIAFYQNRRDEVPNQELARDLAAKGDEAAIQEIAANLHNNNPSIRSDCLKVLYEVGYQKPQLIAPYADEFLGLLDDRNNRMVWGAMIALATIAELRAERIWSRVGKVIEAIDGGTLITLVWGIRTLSHAAAGSASRTKRIIPKLRQYLQTCNARDVPTHLESMLPIIDRQGWAVLARVVESRKKEMTPSQLARLKRVTKRIEGSG